MPTLYPIRGETWPATSSREMLYDVSTGHILCSVEPPLLLTGGEQAKITAGDWAKTTVMLPAIQLAELRNGNLKLDIGGNPVLIGPKTYTNVKPV